MYLKAKSMRFFRKTTTMQEDKKRGNQVLWKGENRFYRILYYCSAIWSKTSMRNGGDRGY